MNIKPNKQINKPEAISSLEIFRYMDNTLFELKDQVGVESRITVDLENGKQATFPCTSIHLEELALGLAFSKNAVNNMIDNSIHPVETIYPFDKINYEKLLICFKAFSSASPLFRATGSVHSGQLLDLDFNVHFYTEDMSRHNVIDKIIGFIIKNDIDCRHFILMISSRIPLELAEKIYRIGITNIAAISAPTEDTVLFCKERNINLIGMYRDSRFNIYSK